MSDAPVSFELSIGSARFCLTGPQAWVDDHVRNLLAMEQFVRGEDVQDRESEGSISQSESGWPPHVMRWLRRNGIAEEQLSHFIHVEGENSTVIASELRGSGKSRVAAAYLLEGLASFAVSETKRFSDKAARDLLARHGAYDKNNHAVYFREALQGKLIGDKESGFALSVPGLAEAAKVVKSHSEGSAN